MIRPFVSTPALYVQSFAMLVALASVGTGQSGPKPSPEAGTEFDMKTTIAVSGGMSTMLGGMSPGYSGHGFALRTRMRIDIVDGSLPPLAETGDYFLFDSTGMTIVHPAKKEFSPVSPDASTKLLEQMQALGMTISVGDVAVTFDSIPGTDTIAGYPTRHFRATVVYTMSIDGMGMSQKVRSEATNEYWMAPVPGLGANPLQRTGALSGGQGLSAMASAGPFKELVARADSLTRLLHGTALRTKTTTTSDAGVGIDMTGEVSNVKRAQVAESAFVIPADFTRSAGPGT